MTTVTASPAAVGRLAGVLAEAAERIGMRVGPLGFALGAFVATAPGFASRASGIFDILAQQRRTAHDLAVELAWFVAGLQAADEAGVALPVGLVLRRVLPDAQPDTLLVQHDAFARSQPFLAAAFHGLVVLTPDHVGALRDLDRLVMLPLADFLVVRAQAEASGSPYDWTADGCSGPIPDGARDICLRHDFMYRNARMLRDRWGLGRGFAAAVKRAADGGFVAELEDHYSSWELMMSPVLRAWISGADVAVTHLGDVNERWSPAPPGRFYGSVQPDG